MTKPILSVLTAALMLTSCQPSTHPNQINEFDGKTYDTLLLTHTALAELREAVRIEHRQFVPAFNSTTHAYNAAYDAYALYRLDPQSGALKVSTLLRDLASNVKLLERALTTPLPVPPVKQEEIRQKARVRKGSMATSRPSYEMSLVDVLTELQVGATIAQNVPVVSPYATIALMIINATKSAVQTSQSHSKKLIDIALLTPIAPI